MAFPFLVRLQAAHEGFRRESGAHPAAHREQEWAQGDGSGCAQARHGTSRPPARPPAPSPALSLTALSRPPPTQACAHLTIAWNSSQHTSLLSPVSRWPLAWPDVPRSARSRTVTSSTEHTRVGCNGVVQVGVGSILTGNQRPPKHAVVGCGGWRWDPSRCRAALPRRLCQGGFAKAALSRRLCQGGSAKAALPRQLCQGSFARQL